MKKTIFFSFILCIIFRSSLCSSNEIDSPSFSSIDEVVSFETLCISEISNDHFADLSDAYASRGESYLLCDRFGPALDDFQKAYDLAACVDDPEMRNVLFFRSLFGQALAYGHFDRLEEVTCLADTLNQIIQSISCDSAKNTNMNGPAVSTGVSDLKFPLVRYENIPLNGPDQISMQDCVDLVDTTERLCNVLICKAPVKVQPILLFTIQQLAVEARKCCRAGGFWKACFQKLGNKYYQWNRKWKIFGIPPDPAWN